MTDNKILRMAIVLGDSDAKKFSSNLRKIIKLILFDNYDKKLSVSELKEILKEEYELEFSEYEILQVTDKIKGIVIQEHKDSMLNRYTITPDEYERVKDLYTTNIEEHIQKFLSENESKYSFEELKGLIYDFLYNTFNADTKTLLELMHFCDTPNDDNEVVTNFSPDESRAINEFLNWDNKEKNEFILNLIAACFEYCILTIKKDTNSFAHIFKGKEFYLDTNIVFRLAGFNNEERQNVMIEFIKKCQNAGIEICYTNHTAAEIQNTINYRVGNLKHRIGNSEPLSVRAMRIMESKYENNDFYEQYFEWCKNKRNKVGDYKAFNAHLEKEVNRILRRFKKVVVKQQYELRDKHNFDVIAEDFKSYKESHSRVTYINAIKTDVNNYLYMSEKNDATNASNFLDMKYYFITADHFLTEWAIDKRPGTVPIFVLPSVWYSILLKYKGRTENDYKAFCQFLNIRIAPEKDKLKDIKEKIFPKIMSMNEEKEIKEEIIYDIDKRLSENSITEDEIDEFVEQSHKTILESKIEQATKENKEEIKELRQKVDALQNPSITEESFHKGEDAVLIKQAQDKSKKRKKIGKIAIITCIIGIVILISTFIVRFCLDDAKGFGFLVDLLNNNQGLIEVIGLIIAVIGGLARLLISYCDFFTVDEKKIEEHLRKKYEKKE